jgi:hypothetical protein
MTRGKIWKMAHRLMIDIQIKLNEPGYEYDTGG